MDCFFPLFLVRWLLHKCRCTQLAREQGRRKEGCKNPGKSLGQHHRPPWVSILAFTLECKCSTELSSLPAADVGGSGCSLGRLPGSEGHLLPGLCCRRKEVCSHLVGW